MVRTVFIASIFLFLAAQPGIAYGSPSAGSQAARWKNEKLDSEGLSAGEYRDSIIQYGLGSLWTETDNRNVLGFIGTGYQRLRIKILSVTKDSSRPDSYLVVGKSMVKKNICRFTGTIRITNARIYRSLSKEDRAEGIKKRGILIAEYHFTEDTTKAHSGSFDGILSTSWYLGRDNQPRYDDMEEDDGYANNQFVGIWKSYKGSIARICNWGDYRIPFSGDLDAGAGEFYPIDQYLDHGWQSYRDAYFQEDSDLQPAARKEEEREWWK